MNTLHSSIGHIAFNLIFYPIITFQEYVPCAEQCMIDFISLFY